VQENPSACVKAATADKPGGGSFGRGRRWLGRWLPKPCESGAQKRRALRAQQSARCGDAPASPRAPFEFPDRLFRSGAVDGPSSTTGRRAGPVAKHAVARCGGAEGRSRRNQLAASQNPHCGLCGALRQARGVGDAAQARLHRSPAGPRRRRIEVQIHKECRRLLVMADQVAQEHIKHVGIHRNGSALARHGGSIPYTFNRTRLFGLGPAFHSTPPMPRPRLPTS
jgi:hypothetical protein